MSITARQKLVEELFSAKYNKEMTIKDIMKLLYVDEHKTQQEMARELHVSVGTINAWLLSSGISGRKMYWI